MTSYQDTMRQRVSTPFQDTFEAAHRRRVRMDIRRSRAISPAVARFLELAFNIWAQTGVKDGFIHPGAKKLSKMLGFSERTVRTYLAFARERAVMRAVAFLKGGRKATRYVLDIAALYRLIMPHDVVAAPGELREVQRPEKRRRVGLSSLKSFFGEFVNTLQMLQTDKTSVHADASPDPVGGRFSDYHPAFPPADDPGIDLAKNDNRDCRVPDAELSTFAGWLGEAA